MSRDILPPERTGSIMEEKSQKKGIVISTECN